MPQKIKVSFLLADPLLEKLKKHKEMTGSPYSATIREAITQYFGGDIFVS